MLPLFVVWCKLGNHRITPVLPIHLFIRTVYVLHTQGFESVPQTLILLLFICEKIHSSCRSLQLVSGFAIRTVATMVGPLAHQARLLHLNFVKKGPHQMELLAWNRTRDPRITNAVLYQLSYGSKLLKQILVPFCFKMADTVGFEPTSYRVTTGHPTIKRHVNKNLVDLAGIEPAQKRCKRPIIPLDQKPTLCTITTIA